MEEVTEEEKKINPSTIFLLILSFILSVVTLACFVECLILKNEATIKITRMSEKTNVSNEVIV